MPGRGQTVRRVSLGLAVVVAAVLVLGGATWMTRRSGPPVRVVSNEGGFSLEVPTRWHTEHRIPTKEHADFLFGHEKALLPFLERGGFWMARWAVASDASAETILDQRRAEQAKKPRAGWDIAKTQLAGQAAVVMRYSEEPPELARRLRPGQRQVVMYELIARGFNYQLGLWTLPHAGGVRAELDKIAASLELFAPRRWTLEVGDTGARVTLPGGWAPTTSDLPRVVLHALAPGDPSEAWVYVFNFTDSPAATLRGALRNIPANGGTIIGQRRTKLGGRPATRLDFTFPDEGHPPANDVEWLFSDGQGGTLVLVVGRRSGDPDIAERIAATWEF